MKQNRRSGTRITALLLALLLILTGCSGTTGESTTTAATTTKAKNNASEEKKTLSVYLLNYGGTEGYAAYAREFVKWSDKALEVELEEFTDPESMQERLRTELPAGEGPDLILAEYFLGLDLMVLAQNGAFYDLTDIISNDELFTADEYYMPVMKAGQIDGRQYIVPLYFTVSAFGSTTSALEEAGIDWNNPNTIEVYEQTLRFLQTTEIEQITGFTSYRDIASAMLISVGKDPADFGTDAFSLEDESVQTVLKLAAECYKQRTSWLSTHNNNTSDGHYRMAAQLPMQYSNFFSEPSMYQWMYSGYAAENKAEEFELYFPTADENGSIHAQVPYFAAVSANAQYPELAWQMIRYMINQRPAGLTGVSLKRSLMKQEIHALRSSTWKGPQLELIRLPEEYADQIADAYDRITDASLYQDVGAAGIINSAMIDYATGKMDFDTMLSDISGKLNLYLNE